DPVLLSGDGLHSVRRRDRVRLSLGGRLPGRRRGAFRRDGRLPRDPRRRLRLPLEEGGFRLVSHRRYSLRETGRPGEFPAEARARIERILTRYPTKQAALLPVLWVAQETWGWISKEAAEEVARILELTPAHVDGVLTFYTMYNLKPVGRNLLQFCTSI